MLIILAGITIISASSLSINEAMALPHASLIVDSEEEHANPIEIVLGHTDEPAFGKLPGIHDGKHFVEVRLLDERTVLPLQGGQDFNENGENGNGENPPNNNGQNGDESIQSFQTMEPPTQETLPPTELFVDKYYFKNIESFENAQSPEDADAIERNVPLTPVFGEPGLYYDRQIVDEGIYGYTLSGTINYYDVAHVPLAPTTKFCTSQEGDTSKFDSPGWVGSFGCVENIKSIFFPPANKYPDNYNNNYPPQYPQYGDKEYGNYEQQYQQQQQFLYNNNNNYGYVNEDYKQYNNNNNNYYDDQRDDSRDREDKKDDYKSDSRDNKKDDRNDDEYQDYDNNNKYGDQYRDTYTTDDSADYGNEYASYKEE